MAAATVPIERPILPLPAPLTNPCDSLESQDVRALLQLSCGCDCQVTQLEQDFYRTLARSIALGDNPMSKRIDFFKSVGVCSLKTPE